MEQLLTCMLMSSSVILPWKWHLWRLDRILSITLFSMVGVETTQICYYSHGRELYWPLEFNVSLITFLMHQLKWLYLLGIKLLAGICNIPFELGKCKINIWCTRLRELMIQQLMMNLSCALISLFDLQLSAVSTFKWTSKKADWCKGCKPEECQKVSTNVLPHTAIFLRRRKGSLEKS